MVALVLMPGLPLFGRRHRRLPGLTLFGRRHRRSLLQPVTIGRVNNLRMIGMNVHVPQLLFDETRRGRSMHYIVGLDSSQIMKHVLEAAASVL